ncbi:MAG: glycosyltransferase [Candidatus Thiodiazotropha taylori]|nr:glycosyltransferase [Candidatus Thiodiazotropha taylori]
MMQPDNISMQISVIIPCYNAESSVLETIHAIKAQTIKAFEIIVVDDGSSDSTLQLLKKEPDVIVIKQENSGVSAARNRGVSKSTGDWIAFCDADDVWTPNKLEVVTNVIENSNYTYKILFHDFYSFKDQTITAHHVTHSGDTIFPSIKHNSFDIRKILKEKKSHTISIDGRDETISSYWGGLFPELAYGNLILPSSVVIDKQLFTQYRGFDVNFRSAEETEFFLRLSTSESFCYIDSELCGYRLSDNSITSNKEPLLKQGLSALKKNCISNVDIYAKNKHVINDAYRKKLYKCAYYYLTVLDRDKALEFMIEASQYGKLDRYGYFLKTLSILPTGILKLLRSLKSKLSSF